MYRFYRTITWLVSPIVPVMLKRRMALGKEDAERLHERVGVASAARPDGKLVWIHAASIGESNSVLPLIEALLKEFPLLHVLLTTVTVTSAMMMEKRLPVRALHQYAPVDTLDAVSKFLEHWKPDIALWVDSEIWPNIIMETSKRGAVMGIINARMSYKSFRSWRFARGFIKDILACFTLCFAQSEEDMDRLIILGIPSVTAVCNLKYDAPALPCDDNELANLRSLVGKRHLWLAASTHPGEEKIIAGVHESLRTEFPGLLTIIVPRHAKRGDEIAVELSSLKIVQRSKNGSIEPDTDIYIADTMGELGIFYRLAKIVFIGGTLVPHGGQNPLEPARIGCAIITGPHYYNFRTVINGMQDGNAIASVSDGEELRIKLKELLENNDLRESLAGSAMEHAKSECGAINKIMNGLQPYIT